MDSPCLFFVAQILEDKFLIAFGPCKHGKYRETTYQDTYVFDIVDYHDAQRHTILTGDHVLAPWEPEGEMYGPGIVIDGQEKRQAIGEWTFFFLILACCLWFSIELGFCEVVLLNL